MFKIRASNRYVNLQGNYKLYYLLAIGAFISILSFLLYRDVFLTLVMVVCMGALYFIYSQPPRPVEIELSPELIKLNDFELKWEDCISWSLVDLGQTIEFVILTTKVNQSFYYFYLPENDPGLKPLIMEMTKYLPYDENLPLRNALHNLLRRWGLK